MNTHVLLAVFRRNFVSYFANPTGYLFIFLFVSLSTIAGFWVPDFFGNNLANLDQLSFWFPFIMLVYIPTITMGIWAEERKQGTDELLLTIPARDFDIVLGKYLAAVGIFSVSLLFSLFCNYLVLNNLASTDSWIAVMPRLDFGLFLSTYVGYWLIGLAMLAIGVVASFLTGNITIGFVLGVLLNMPLVFLAATGAVFGGVSRQSTLAVERWSIADRFADFSRGILTISGTAYFVAILLVMLYVSMALIGQRHWFSGGKRWVMAGHYTLRTLALAAIAFGVVAILENHDFRADVTSSRLSSLSPQTVKLLDDLETPRPVLIEAFISPSVPETYVQTRLNLLAVLRELAAAGGPKKVQLQIYDTERYSSEAALADKRYRIEPRSVTTLSHGAIKQDDIFLNVAVRCGIRDVPPVFIDRDSPIEYELVRSICTVCQQKRKKLGVLNTDAQLYGSINMQTMSPTPNWPILDELEKQYEVVKVDPSKPITEKYDVLLAVQPSSLGPQEMDNFLAAVAGGQPTAVFEDPAPLMSAGVPATSAPRRSPGGMNPMFGGGQNLPKGDITKLWHLLGVTFAPDQIVWHDYNPYPKFSYFSKDKEYVFVGPGSGFKESFDAGDPISSGLQQLLLPFPGAIVKLNDSDPKLKFTPLVRTGSNSGKVAYRELIQMSPFGQAGGLNPNRRWISTNTPYVLAAHIQNKVNVVLVADVDLFAPIFFRLREQSDIPGLDVHLEFDNITFVLNSLDALADDSRFIDIRKRRPAHHTLARIEQQTEKAKKKVSDVREELNNDYEEQQKKEDKEIQEKVAELQQRKDMDVLQMVTEVGTMQKHMEQERETRLSQARQDNERKINKIETESAVEVGRVQFVHKMWAVLLPPIPPLLVAVGVFLTRRRREREGVARSRLR